jgi:hypothetical protein
MFEDMLNAYERGTPPRESFYDGYIVNAIVDASYRSMQSKRWEAIELEQWRGESETTIESGPAMLDSDHEVIKREVLPDGSTRWIVRNRTTGEIKNLSE